MAGTLKDYVAYGTLAARPASPAITAVTGGSARYFATDTSTEYAWNGSAWVAVGGGAGGAVTQISSQVVSGSVAASIVFSSIPGTYNHLWFRLMGRGDTAAVSVPVYCRMNGDTATNYEDQLIGANGASVYASNDDSGTPVSGITCGNITAASAGSSVSPGVIRGEILNYAGSTWRKLLLTDDTWLQTDTSGQLYQRRGAGIWRNVAAITSLTLLPTAGNFAIGTAAYLYGVQ